MDALIRLGKIFFSGIFVYSGAEKFLKEAAWTTAYNSTTKVLARAQVPQLLSTLGLSSSYYSTVVTVLLTICALLELSGGLAVAFGGDLCGSVMLGIFLLMVTPFYHYPIDANGGIDKSHLTQVGKNLALFGGCLIIFGMAYNAKYGKSRSEPVTNGPKKTQ